MTAQAETSGLPTGGNPHPRVCCKIINLRRAPERRALMSRELTQAGLDAEFFEAVDFREAGEAALLAECTREGPWGWFHDQNMACTVSHARVWEAFLDGPADYCLVLEDDVFLSPELGRWIDDMSWWPKDADIVKVERWRGRRGVLLVSARHRPHLGRDLRRLYSRHPGSAGYILTRHAALMLLASRPFRVAIDQLLFNANVSPVARRLVRYQVLPALVQQGNDPPGSAPLNAHRPKPPRSAHFRQRLRRGYYELAFPLSTWVGALRRTILPLEIAYAPTALAAPAGPATAQHARTV